MNNPASIDDRSGIATDIAELTAIVAIALCLEQDHKLRTELRQCAGCAADRALRLQLPIGPAGIEILPGGELRPLRPEDSAGAERLDRLIAEYATISDQIIASRAKAAQGAQDVLLPFISPGRIPSRTEFNRLERWTPLLEASAYKFVARAMSELDSCRPVALREAAFGVSSRDTAIGWYYALNHTLAHLTIICSAREARTWLVDMAKSFTWITWTPTFPLVRERTVWLAAAAARSAAASGPDVVDRYHRKLADARHVYHVFDALFGLVAIAFADNAALDAIANAIVAEKRAASGRVVVGPEYADVAYRSAINALRNWGIERDTDRHALAQLGWDPKSSRGLSTRAAFRLDPSAVISDGDMLGFAALPAIMCATPALHYPLQIPNTFATSARA